MDKSKVVSSLTLKLCPVTLIPGLISELVFPCAIVFLRSPVNGRQRRALRIPCGWLVPLPYDIDQVLEWGIVVDGQFSVLGYVSYVKVLDLQSV